MMPVGMENTSATHDTAILSETAGTAICTGSRGVGGAQDVGMNSKHQVNKNKRQQT